MDRFRLFVEFPAGRLHHQPGHHQVASADLEDLAALEFGPESIGVHVHLPWSTGPWVMMNLQYKRIALNRVEQSLALILRQASGKKVPSAMPRPGIRPFFEPVGSGGVLPSRGSIISWPAKPPPVGSLPGSRIRTRLVGKQDP